MLKLYCNKNDKVFSVKSTEYLSDKVVVFGFNGIDKISYLLYKDGITNKNN